MVVSGVRSSCETRARNPSLARLAVSALCRRLVELERPLRLQGARAHHGEVGGQLRRHHRERAHMALLVGVDGTADEDHADHFVQPDQGNGQVHARCRGRSAGLPVLEHEPAQERGGGGGERGPLGRRGSGRRDQVRVTPGQGLEHRAPFVGDKRPEPLQHADHAGLEVVGRLQHLPDVVERAAERLVAGVAGSPVHGSRSGTGRPVSTPRSPSNGDPTRIPSLSTLSRRTSLACRTPRAFRTERPRSRRPSISTYLSWMTLSAANGEPRGPRAARSPGGPRPPCSC